MGSGNVKKIKSDKLDDIKNIRRYFIIKDLKNKKIDVATSLRSGILTYKKKYYIKNKYSKKT